MIKLKIKYISHLLNYFPFNYLGSSVSSTENNINTRLAKAWTANDRHSVTWKSNLSNRIKHSFFPSSGHVNTDLWMPHMDAN